MHFKKEINDYDYTNCYIVHRNFQLPCAFTIFQDK